MSLPKWIGKKESTRAQSDKQTKRLVKGMQDSGLKGVREFCNSGAKHGENDIKSAEFEIEAKTTNGTGYRITGAEIKKMVAKCSSGKIPLFVIELKGSEEELVVMRYTDFNELTMKK